MKAQALTCLALAAMLFGVAAPSQAQQLHGSIAFSQEDGGGYAWGIAWRFGSRSDATAEARAQCRREGGTDCNEVGWFRDACGALAIGGDNGYGAGWGASSAAAERDALRQCRASNDNCRIEVARCSDSRQAVGGTGQTVTIKTEPKCAGLQRGNHCWRETANQPGCYIWTTNYRPDLQVTWTGKCPGGVASGLGTLKWSGIPTESTGELVQGKRHGRWVVREGTRCNAFQFDNGEYVSSLTEC